MDYGDIEHVLETGRITRRPQYNKEHGHWNYVIEGPDLSGEPLAIVFALDEQASELILITARDV